MDQTPIPATFQPQLKESIYRKTTTNGINDELLLPTHVTPDSSASSVQITTDSFKSKYRSYNFLLVGKCTAVVTAFVVTILVIFQNTATTVAESSLYPDSNLETEADFITLDIEFPAVAEDAHRDKKLVNDKLQSWKTEPVNVNSLLEQYRISPESFKVDAQVNPTTLKINGPIDAAQLKKIVGRLSSLTNVTLDMDKFCKEGSNSNKFNFNKNQLKDVKLSFRNVVDFRVENGVEECSLHQWVFQWMFPKLGNLELVNMTLKEEVFGSVHQLLEENKDTLKTITVMQSFICEECYVSDVNYSRIEMIKILQQREKPWPLS